MNFSDFCSRRAVRGALAGASVACLLASTGSTATPPQTTASDAVHDFDGFFGTWRVHHRRLKERLAGSTEWIEFEGMQTMQPILGGAGNMTDNVFYMANGIQRGVTLRAFNPKTKTWSIWWLDGNNPTKIDVPVVGGFEKGTGIFYADDTFKGKPIKVRFLWKDITPDKRTWEQAFSPDGGKAWETNWIAQFTRTGG